MKILAVETSCDDTAAAVLMGRKVVASVVATQDAVHRDYGGIVPELASRSHMRALLPTVRRALADASCRIEDIEAVAVTRGPGLVGSLLVGLSAAKAVAYARKIPFVGVNHLEGHLLSVQIETEVPFPYVALLVSGGHTSLYLARAPGDYRLLGATRDDAAGEAFDKVAKILGLGYPGGREIDRRARGADPTAVAFPRARLKPTRPDRRFDFSFSGIKTAVALYVREGRARSVPETAAGFQEAVVDMLIGTTFAAAETVGAERIVVAGGVSANSRLRQRMTEEGAARGRDVVIPPLRYCTDNAAMIGLAATRRLERGESDPLDLNARAVLDLDSTE